MPATPDPGISVPPESAELDYLMPLHFFLGAMFPLDVTFIPGSEMPEPERHLLVHSSDMTSRLEAFHGSPLDLRVHTKKQSENYLMRAVLLERRDDGEPVEFGAIGIRLDAFSEEARADVVSGEIPLGAILRRHEIPYTSNPRAYFRIQIDDRLSGILHAESGGMHYGRCNELRDPEGLAFADIVEILPRVVAGEAGGNLDVVPG